MRSSTTALVLLLFGAVAAQAQYHPQPNLLGVYFDEQANSISTWAPLFATVPAYVILSDPTMDAVDGWEAGFAVSRHGMITGGTIPNGGSNSQSGPMFSVVYPTPLPCSEHTVLMTLRIMVLDPPTFDTCISMFGIDSPAVPGELPVLYLAGGALMQVQVNAPPGYDVVAQMNGPAPVDNNNGGWPFCYGVVANAPTNWGSAKATYR